MHKAEPVGRIFKLIKEDENPLKAHPTIPSQKEVIEEVRKSKTFCIIYMQYAIPRDNVYFHPYYLEIAEYLDLDISNYLTMTPCGVTQYTNEMVFTKLNDWDNEFTIFSEMKNMKLFKYFRIWKAYYVWRKSIYFRKYCKARKQLKKFHFCENRVLVRALLDIQYECCDMYLESFADLSVDMDVNFFYFLENQIVRYEYLRQRLIRFRHDVLHTISLACHKALYDRGFTYNDSNVPPIIKKCGVWIGGLSYTEKANKRKFCERLASFVKLVDYMTNYMLYRLNKRSYTKMSEMIQIHSDFTPDDELLDSEEHDLVLETVPRKIYRCKWALFQLEVDLTANGDIVLVPSREILCKYLQTITEYWDDAIRVFHNFLNEPILQKFVQPTIMAKKVEWSAGMAPNLYFMMNQDHTMLDHMANVLRVVNLAYDNIWRFLARFDHLVELYREDLDMKDDEMKKETDLQTIRRWIVNYLAQYAAIDKIQPYQPLGVFFVSLVLFQHNYLPLPHHLMDVISNFGPELGRKVIDELLDLSVKITEVVEFQPITLEEKEEYDVTIVETEKQVTYAENRFEYLRELYDLLGEFNLPISPEDFEEYMSLSMVVAKLRNGVAAKMEVMGIREE